MANSRNFNDWISNFRDSISDYEYYVDFRKVQANVERIKVELNILNSLVGSENIESEFIELVKRYPETLKCIPLLIAVREYDIRARDEDGEFLYNFIKPNLSVDQYVVFMRKTGLFDMISNHIINNLVDYSLGIETGLDSNARKNRGGHLMEDLVESFIKKTGIKYYKEMYTTDVQKKWGVDLSKLTNNKKSVKRFDFVVESKGHVFAFEVNFYASGGSKLNETARSYKMLAEESKDIKNFHFVWITDGKGWTSAKLNLQETFDTLENIYCLKELEHGVLGKLFDSTN